DIGIYVREADDIDGLFTDGVTEHLILPFDPGRGFEQTFWAPEFHVIGGELYILFAVSGHTWGPQCHMMRKKKGQSIISADSWDDPVRVCKKDGSPLADKAITLDMTYIKAENTSYVIWSYRENIGTALDSGSMLYIATIDEKEPWKLSSDPVLLTRPLYGWENVSGTINNEGPHGFVKDGRVYVTYSGGSANGYTYALGLLTADESSDLLNLSSWEKSIFPVLTFYSVRNEYGPGHNSFYTDDEGDLMIAYHGEIDINSDLRCDGIRRVHFRNDGTPYFQISQDEDLGTEDITFTLTVE
ncbi:MAG: family 43 glycosylhydrolase, partial [Lachnospiraceae bacterium]|nr:family 43 glycosylhydrolase [Lachnospiraceae bacterium]